MIYFSFNLVLLIFISQNNAQLPFPWQNMKWNIYNSQVAKCMYPKITGNCIYSWVHTHRHNKQEILIKSLIFDSENQIKSLICFQCIVMPQKFIIDKIHKKATVELHFHIFIWVAVLILMICKMFVDDDCNVILPPHTLISEEQENEKSRYWCIHYISPSFTVTIRSLALDQ